MMKSKKIGFALTLLLWLCSLCVVGLARRVIAHEYLHSLSPQAKTELPSSTRRVALPILAADVTQGLSKAPFYLLLDCRLALASPSDRVGVAGD